MNPVISKTFTYLMLANGFAFSGWVIRNYLINWWVLEKLTLLLLLVLWQQALQ